MKFNKYIISSFVTIVFICVFVFFINKNNNKYVKTEHKIYFNKDYFNVYKYEPKCNIKKTYIILPSYSYFDANIWMETKKYVKYEPNKDFELLTDKLVKNGNRVIVVEYFGYNNSGETSRKRYSDNICEEIHKVVEYFNLNKYILLPHSISGLYSLAYLSKYRNEVEGFVGIDITLPYYFLEESGSNEEYLKHKFDDNGQKIPESYKKMYNYFWETSKKLENFIFDNDLPIILFTSTMLINSINEQIKKGLLKTKVIDYLNNRITNKDIQSIKILDGTHYLHKTQSDIMSKNILQNFK